MQKQNLIVLGHVASFFFSFLVNNFFLSFGMAGKNFNFFLSD